MRITNIQHFSIDDGPGIRTTVFTAGCNLRCRWCHNPEAMIRKPRIMYEREKCIHCLACMHVCTNKVHRFVENMTHLIEWELCDSCFRCTRECPAGALKPSSRECSPGEILREILQDQLFYQGIGKREQGGVTFSGGEPLLQGEELYELVKMCKEQKISVAIDTAANIPISRIESLLEYVDLFLIDCKAYSEEIHIKGTGVSNRQILDNIVSLTERDIPVWIRVPVIPGFNDMTGEMEKIAEFLAGLKIRKVELLPYHKMGVNKYRMLDLPYNMREIKSPDEQHMRELADIFLAKEIRTCAHTL